MVVDTPLFIHARQCYNARDREIEEVSQSDFGLLA